MSAPARLRVLAACGWLVACNPPGAGDGAVAPTPPAEAESRCAEPPPATLALLADETCPWALVPADRSGVVLHELALAGPRALAVVAPPGCGEGCGFRGVVTAIGPIVIATRASRISEGAVEAYVGAAPSGATIRFTPLWFDRSALGDATPLGPSHALAPWICGTDLVLAVAPRLPGAGAEEPSDGLRAAAGVYAIKDDELQRTGPTPDLGGCMRVAVELP
jgi:hypothetical protein